MKTKACLITAAGLGTRMGPIGQNLPKPLWPIFSQTLLDVQLEYIKRFNVDKIFINCHHQARRIQQWAEDKDVIILEEQTLLGSGGCIHNLKAKYPEVDKLWVVNSDQFFFLNEDLIKDAEKRISEFSTILFALYVDKNEKYNELIVENERIVDIKPNRKIATYMTYSGVCLIDMEKLVFKPGENNFFDTVCDYKNSKNNYLNTNTKDIEFWDFGTKENYVRSLYKCLENSSELGNVLGDFEYTKEKGDLLFEKYTTKVSQDNQTIEIDGIIDQI